MTPPDNPDRTAAADPAAMAGRSEARRSRSGFDSTRLHPPGDRDGTSRAGAGEDLSRQRSRPESSQGGLYGSEVGVDGPRAAVAELVGTFVLVLAGIAVAVAAALGRPIAGDPYDSLAIALAFGLALAAVVAAIGHVSGGHVNPAVTLGLAATGKFPWRLVPTYLLAQLAGALLAGLATWAVFGDAARERAVLGATSPTQAASVGQALIVEILITFILVFIVLAVATDERAPSQAAPLAVGFTLSVGVLIGGPISGGAVNPARALGPMLAAGELSSAFWLYIVGPVLGGVIAAVLYDRFISQTEAPG